MTREFILVRRRDDRWSVLSARIVTGDLSRADGVSVIGGLSVKKLSLPPFGDMAVLIRVSSFCEKFSIGVYNELSRLMHFEKSFSSVLIFLIF